MADERKAEIEIEIPLGGFTMLNGAFEHSDKLHSIIDRAEERLASTADDLIALRDKHPGVDRLCRAIVEALAILAEATPPAEEGESDGNET